MKIKTFVDISEEIEVDVSMDDIFRHWHSLPSADFEMYWVNDAILAAHAILRRVPDEIIDKMSAERRRLIVDSLLEQAKRFEYIDTIAGLFEKKKIDEK